MFHSSLAINQALETPPGELPPFVAYRLNGEPIPLERGGPVRMVVPWAHGFKSIKWLQQIVLTNDFQANDTYAHANNDPESYLKTAAYLDEIARSSRPTARCGSSGLAIAGMSGLERVEYWLRRVDGKPARAGRGRPGLGPRAEWVACRLERPPSDWRGVLPDGCRPARSWASIQDRPARDLAAPLQHGLVVGHARDLSTGTYEVRARAVDLNGFAQPEPRPYLKSGKNPIQVRRFEIA